MPVKFMTALIVFAVLAFISIAAKKLTVAAGIAGWIVASIIYAGAGTTGVVMLAVFFILGTAATSHKHKAKLELLLREENKTGRDALQVLANAGVATLVAAFIIFFPQHKMPGLLLIAGSLSSATADTISSEIGNVYGSSFYNILTLKKDARGLDGVISIEGTLAGIAGSAIIAIIYFVAHHSFQHCVLIVVSGTAGNLLDSLFGATLERKGLLSNNQVNFLNTLAGALVALLLFLLL